MVEGTITGPIDPITNQVMGVDIMVEAFWIIGLDE